MSFGKCVPMTDLRDNRKARVYAPKVRRIDTVKPRKLAIACLAGLAVATPLAMLGLACWQIASELGVL